MQRSPRAKAKIVPPIGDSNVSLQAQGTGAPFYYSTADREDTISTTITTATKETTAASFHKENPELAKLLAAELIPSLQDAFVKNSPKASSHFQLESKVDRMAKRLEELMAVAPKIDALAPKIDKLQEGLEILERRLDRGAPKSALQQPPPAASPKNSPGKQPGMRRGSGDETPVERSEGKRVTLMDHRLSEFREASSVNTSIFTKNESVDNINDSQRLHDLLGITDEQEPANFEDDVSADRTVVVNIRRFRNMLEASGIFLQVIRWGGLLVIALSSLSRGMWWSDWAFALFVLIQQYVHVVRHGVFTVATDRFYALGEHFGDDGQAVLDALAPGMENPNSCIQALTWRRKRHTIAVGFCSAILFAACAGAWVLVLLSRFQNMSLIPAEELEHVVMLAAVGTCIFLSNTIFAWLIDREMHFVLPMGKDGRPWDILSRGAPGLLGACLGAPCIWFGSERAYDDLRLWVAMASSRQMAWSGIVQNLAEIYPEEIGVYALQGRETAARLAHSLYSAKLFDSHRQVFARRQLDPNKDTRPSIIVTGLSGDKKRGHLFDLDVRRELPEGLHLHLVLYDSRTGLMWTPRRTARDPLEWVSMQKCLAPLTTIEELNEEVPIWNQDRILGSNSRSDMFCGTFSGYRVVVSVARSEATIEGIHAEIAALKKIGDHPNILSLLTSGVSPEGQHYMGLETYEAVGCLLSQLANYHAWGGTKLHSSLATKIFKDLIEGLTHLHDHAMLHRSLRAEGVVVTMESTARLADVGIVSRMGVKEPLKATHCAPEVCRGLAQTAAVDCWGLGVILHQVYQGRADLVDCRFNPPRQRPGTPADAREMDFFIQGAMKGLLKFDPGQRWSLSQLRDSSWLTQHGGFSTTMEAPPTEFESRSHLRRFMGRAPPPTACAVHLTPDFKGIIGKTLGAIRFEEHHLRVLLVIRGSGAYLAPRPTLKLEAGDSICFGLAPDDDTEMMLSRLDDKLEAATAYDLPVAGFFRAREKQTAPLKPHTASSPMKHYVLFHAEFDCFVYPSHTARAGRETIGMLQEMGIYAHGLLRPGQWQPNWFMPRTTQLEPGDLLLVVRAPRTDGHSVPSVTDNDLFCVMDEQEMMARLAVARGLQDATV